MDPRRRVCTMSAIRLWHSTRHQYTVGTFQLAVGQREIVILLGSPRRSGNEITAPVRRYIQGSEIELAPINDEIGKVLSTPIVRQKLHTAGLVYFRVKRTDQDSPFSGDDWEMFDPYEKGGDC